jgi:hypothetical protein
MLIHSVMPEDAARKEIPAKVVMTFYGALLALGLSIYIGWGLMYGSWNIFDRSNLGIYSSTVLLCGFGLVGIVLYTIKARDSDK